MRARSWALTAMAGLAAALLPALGGDRQVAHTAAGTPAIAVSGSSWMYTTFDPTIERYAVHPAADGSLHVDVTGPQAVSFNGVPDPDGSADFVDVRAGDEVSVSPPGSGRAG